MRRSRRRRLLGFVVPLQRLQTVQECFAVSMKWKKKKIIVFVIVIAACAQC